MMKKGLLKVKKAISLILSFIIVFSFLIFTVSANNISETTELIFGVFPFNDKSTVINWWKNEVDGKYYLFLPADSDSQNLQIIINTDNISINETVVQNGEYTTLLQPGNEYTVMFESREYDLIVMQSANIPSVYITTESGSLNYIHANKSNKEKAEITIVEDGNIIMSNTKLKQIKGRGNSTWDLKKKPYNITFDEKTDLFGMGSAKKWSLLASFADRTFLRNSLAFLLSNEIGLHYTSNCKHVDLYINGEYQGNYIITESVEIGKTRVNINNLANDNEDANPDTEDIEELPQNSNISPGITDSSRIPGSMKWVDIPNNPEDISGGYLLETDYQYRYAEEISGFVTAKGQCIVVKEPEYASKAEVEYISKIFNEAEEALYAEDGYNSLGNHYSEYFDIDSLAKIYIIQEFCNNYDAGISSCYFYKEKGNDKLIASPVWDFDIALGRDVPYGDINIMSPTIWFTNNRYNTVTLNGKETDVPTIFNLAYRHEDFRSLVNKLWTQRAEVFSAEKLVDYIDENSNLLFNSAISDNIRWRDIGIADMSSAEKFFTTNVDILRSFVIERIKTLNTGFSNNSAFLYYNINGENGNMVNFKITEIGTNVKIAHTYKDDFVEMWVNADSTVFCGWNTEADGSGTMYYPEDTILLDKAVTTLYAQWKNISSSDILYGDVDLDETISAADARLILRATVGLEFFGTDKLTIQYVLSDVNKDNTVSAADARLVLRKSVGLIDEEFTTN